MQLYPNITSSTVQEALDPLLVDPLQQKLCDLTELQNNIILDLIVIHCEVCDKIIKNFSKFISKNSGFIELFPKIKIIDKNIN